jgi:putative acetyltransferase
MLAVQIREVESTDNAALATVIRNAFEEHGAPKEGTVYSDPTTDALFQLFQAKKSVLWVAEEDSEILGCCGVYPTNGLDKDTAELAKFYILEKARGKGIGKALLLKCIDSARELGYARLYLESLPQYAKAVGMYERSGFILLDAPMGASGHTSCNIWMIKEL